MPKVKISEYSATANSNTDVASINIDEGCAPSGINNAIRAIMGHLKDFQSGTNGDPFNGPVNGTLGATTASTANVTTLTTSSTVTHNGGTANGVAYLNGSKVLTTGSALVFDGTSLGVGVTPTTGWYSLIRANQTLSASFAGLTSGTTYVTYVGSNWFVNSVAADKYIANGFASLYTQASGQHQWSTAGSNSSGAGAALTFTQAMTLDASGNLAIGTTETGVGKVNVQLAGAVVSGNTTGAAVGAGSIFQLNNANGGATNSTVMLLGGGTGANAGQISSGIGFTREDENNWGTQLRFYTHQSTTDVLSTLNERARIDSSGNLLVGTTSGITAQTGVASKHNISTSTGTAYGLTVSNVSTEAFGLAVKYTGASPNNGGSSFLWCADGGGTQRAAIYSNGGLANYSANNVNLSDQRVKKDIQNAGSYLAKICAIPVRTFLYKDQTDSLLNLGVIAQEVEAIAPELVDIQGFGDTTPDDGVPLKAIYQTDLQYALMKCIQEQQAIITQLTARITALEGA